MAAPSPSADRLFWSSPSPKPKPPCDSPAPAPTASPTTPTPRRRTPLSPRPAHKRSPLVSRAWNRRLSFSGASPGSSAGPSTPFEASSSSDLSSGAVTPFALDDAEAADAVKQGGFTFSPAKASAALPSALPIDAFDLSGMAMEIDEAAGVAVSPPRTQQSPLRKWDKVTTRRPRIKRVKTGINDLPDELLLRIFSFLNDQQGFRPLPSKITSDMPEWYTPPVRIGLVCQRWLPLARHLYYRFVKISHLSRISALYRTFATNGDLPLSVRHLCIDLPSAVLDKLDLPAPGRLPPSTPTREADSDVEPVAPAHLVLPVSNSPTKKPKAPLTQADELRAVFQSCSHLLSLEIAGVPPATLFTSSSSSLSALHRLHQLRLSTVTSLTLRGDSSSLDASDAPTLTSTTVRDALFALTGLRRLTLKQFASSALISEALDFAPKRTSLGFRARPLPARARSNALLPLERLALLECCVSPADLLALLRQCQRGRLRALIVEDAWTAADAARNRARHLWELPTCEALGGGGGADERAIAALVRESLVSLRATLHNYPPVTGVAGALASTSMRSPERATRPLPGGRSGAQRRDKHVLDAFIAQLDNLVVLDVGGTVVTPALFPPEAPRSPSYSASAASTTTAGASEEPLLRLPRSVRSLTLRTCPLLPPSSLLPFLSSLAPSPSLSSSPRALALHTLHTLGGSEHGWSNPAASWAVQRACWDAGVRWISARQAGGWVVDPSAAAAAAAAAATAGGGTGDGKAPVDGLAVIGQDQDGTGWGMRREGARVGGGW
ncbi:F-box protein [Rhodotorula paludigena]|uniref:F-box protein n=1 Tax=Rhodotorula paludigena TaxID=86838 RepID=UPI00317C76C8